MISLILIFGFLCLCLYFDTQMKYSTAMCYMELWSHFVTPEFLCEHPGGREFKYLYRPHFVPRTNRAVKIPTLFAAKSFGSQARGVCLVFIVQCPVCPFLLQGLEAEGFLGKHMGRGRKCKRIWRTFHRPQMPTAWWGFHTINMRLAMMKKMMMFLPRNSEAWDCLSS